ncbi:MAG: cobalamin biosynthesis protein, partial [Rhodospirillaceae bacterium]|nr:cobalamin biosynthesis protein [Rhodospirillaceae bacterium]
VVPATAGAPALASAFAGCGGVAVIKIAKRLNDLKSVATANGRLATAKLVSFASTPQQKVEPLSEAESAPYFSLALFPPLSQREIPVAKNAAVVVLNRAGLDVAKTLKKKLPGAELFARFDADAADQRFEHTGELLRKLFKAGQPIVAVASAAIVVRSLSGALSDKTIEPPVIAVSADGAHSVPLLGGHRGANDLARFSARALGGQAAITTASDGVLGVALDAPPAGWHLANPEAHKDIASEILNGNALRLEVEAGSPEWLTDSAIVFGEGDFTLHVSPLDISPPEKTLLLHPPVLALGVGCERGCDGDELYALAMKTLTLGGFSEKSVACVCSLDVKSDEAAVLQLAQKLGVAARFFSKSQLEAETPRLANPSNVVFAEVGCHGVSEAAALAAVGPQGKLALEKQKSKRATCAIGLSPTDLDPQTIGRGRGRLFIVGTGPGKQSWRTPEAVKILSEVTDVVGYGLYLDLISDLIEGKNRHTSDLAQEEARVRRSLELAAEGRDVALVSSGDPGIYAMAALAYELLDREDRADWNRLAVQVVPGISAFQAAAAKIGAPMGHDFCLISLSDLLTP